MQKEHPAVVHVDGTSRIQIVCQEKNLAFYGILSEYKKITGKGILLNTSLNIHEEPIARTPEEGIAVFLAAQLDYLAIGNYLVAAEHMKSL
jgi:carbamoyltransferase